MIKIKIGGIPYTLRRVKSFLDVDHFPEDRENVAELWGQISYQHHSIRFVTTLKERETVVLLHEVLHGIIEHNQIRELMDKNGIHSEIAINQLALGLAEVLKSMHIELPLDKV